jgi:hypothetical protein
MRNAMGSGLGSWDSLTATDIWSPGLTQPFGLGTNSIAAPPNATELTAQDTNNATPRFNITYSSWLKLDSLTLGEIVAM